jgi:Tfp pilus assembly protein PilO
MEYPKFMSTFIRQITELAKNSGCTLKSISPKPADPTVKNDKEGIAYRPVQVDIAMSASYAGIDRFLEGLSLLPKVVKVTQIELSRQPVDRSTRKIKLDARLVLVLYMLETSEKPS